MAHQSVQAQSVTVAVAVAVAVDSNLLHTSLPTVSSPSKAASSNHNWAGHVAADADVTTKKHPNFVLPKHTPPARPHTQQLLTLSPLTAAFQSCLVDTLALQNARLSISY